ncbi:O-antigen ligase family protein [Cohnella zeiphila]|uniref:O-antigen ligase family protein n=1 Tax=Cohnella zeiphila TaxID=2761120 RepID=A0A7X0SQA8_9BACL|nr:O-antigen ligase family protein [Cohnella zeiphila]MBB6731943.1 O-antigen ligase family protein [Cohnella zeiphila]
MIGFFRRITGVAIACAMAFVLCLSAYRQGLFFDPDLYPFELALIGCAAIAGLAGALGVGSLRVRPWMLAPLAVAAAYALQLAIHPESVKGTEDHFLRWTAYGCWTVLLGLALASPKRRTAGWIAFQAAGAFVVLGGWAGWAGLLRFPEVIFRSDESELASTGARLAGFLQYPNAYGAVVAFLTLVQWQLLRSGRKGAAAYGAYALVPCLSALMLTESRGAMLALALGFVLSLALGKRSDRGIGMAVAGLSLAISAGVASVAFAAMRSGFPGPSLWALAAGTIVGGPALRALCPRSGDAGDGSGWRRRSGWETAADRIRSFPGGLVLLLLGMAAAYLLLAGGGHIPSDGGESRLNGNLETAASRQIYYADALRMFRDRPWLGAGGESWRMLVGLYQTSSYSAGEVHSGYLNILIDVGLAGLLALLAFLVGYAARLWGSRAVSWGPAAVLLAHAAVDFDWSYGFVWLLLLAWLALHMPAAEEDAAGVRRRRFALAPRRAAPLCAALLLGFAAAALPAAWRSASAVREYDAALASNYARESHLRAALAANPEWTRIRLELVPLLPAAERESLLAAGLRYEPHSPPLELQLGMTDVELGKAAAARGHFREGLRLSRFDREAQNAAIAQMASLADRLANAGRQDEARVAAAGAVEFYENYRQLYRDAYAGTDNPWDDKERALFVGAKVNAARALILLGRREEAREILLEASEENAPDWQEQANDLLRQFSSSGG